MAYKEYLDKRKKGVKEILLAALIYLAALILSFFCIMLVPGFGLLLSLGCFYAGYWLSAKLNREFEYTFTEDAIDIDVIYNAARRKRLISFYMKDVELIAPLKSGENKRFENNGYKVIDATTNSKNATVYFAAVKKNGDFIVKFEPPVTALGEFRKYAPSKVVMD